MHYSGPVLESFRFQQFKVRMTGRNKGGLPEMEFYNVRRDPGERYGAFYAGLFAITPMQGFLGRHMSMVKKFPHRDPSESRARSK